jgi:hypothetical protein
MMGGWGGGRLCGDGDDVGYIWELWKRMGDGIGSGAVMNIGIYFQNGFKDGVVFVSVLFVKLFSSVSCYVNIVLFQRVKFFAFPLVV